MHLAMTFPAQHDAIKQRRLRLTQRKRPTKQMMRNILQSWTKRNAAEAAAAEITGYKTYADLLEALDTRRKQSQGDEYGQRRR